MSAPCALLGPGWGEGGVGEWAQLPPCVRPGRSWRWRPRSASLQALRPHLCAALCPRVSVSLLDLRPCIPVPSAPPCLCIPASRGPSVSVSPPALHPCSPGSLHLCVLNPCTPYIPVPLSLHPWVPSSPVSLHPCHLCTSMSLHPWVPSSPDVPTSSASLHLCVLNPCISSAAPHLSVPAAPALYPCSPVTSAPPRPCIPVSCASLHSWVPVSLCPHQLCTPAAPDPCISVS